MRRVRTYNTAAWTAERTAYFAGFFDGEGTIGAYPPEFTLSVGVTGTHRASIDAFLDYFGCGSLSEKGHSKLGSRRVWNWNARGEDAVVVLRELAPHLTVKREQAEEAMRYPLTRRGGVRQYTPTTPAEKAERARIGAALVQLKKAN